MTNAGCRTCKIAIEDEHDDVRGWFLLHALIHTGAAGAYFCGGQSDAQPRRLGPIERVESRAFLSGYRSGVAAAVAGMISAAQDAGSAALQRAMENA